MPSMVRNYNVALNLGFFSKSNVKISFLRLGKLGFKSFVSAFAGLGVLKELMKLD